MVGSDLTILQMIDTNQFCPEPISLFKMID